MKPYLYAPGVGKTRAVIHDLIAIQQRGRPSIIAVPTLKLMEEIASTVTNTGGLAAIEYSAKFAEIEGNSLIYVTTHSYIARLCFGNFPQNAVVVVDECHKMKTRTIRDVVNAAIFANGWSVLMTATPSERMKDLDAFLKTVPAEPMPNLVP